jgi:hypothetical protein
VRAGKPTGSGIRLRVYGVRLATVPADGGYQLVTDEQGRLVPTGEQYRIPRAPAARAADGGSGDCAGQAGGGGAGADSPDGEHPHHTDAEAHSDE